MDIYASDPILIAAQQHRSYSHSSDGTGATLSSPTGLTTTGHNQTEQYHNEQQQQQQDRQQQHPYRPSADIMELCRIFLLNFYMKHFGRVRLFDMLQREHERRNLATNRSYALLLACFTITWLLQSNLYRFIVNVLRQQLGTGEL